LKNEVYVIDLVGVRGGDHIYPQVIVSTELNGVGQIITPNLY